VDEGHELVSDLQLLSPAGPLAAIELPTARVERIIVHWTAGGPKASALDRAHYHLLIEQSGRVVPGLRRIGLYLPHTRRLNTGSIGVALCGMAGARQNPYHPGPSPITARQMEVLVQVCACLMERYGLPFQEKTLLSHADVERVYGIVQRGKWDITFWPGDPEIPRTARDVAHVLRKRVQKLLLSR
jgi:hypothetical protein